MHPNFHIRPATLATTVTEVPSAAEKSGEEVKGVMAMSAAAAGLVLGKAFMAVLIIDAASLGVG